jgi:hypothetical protein
MAEGTVDPAQTALNSQSAIESTIDTVQPVQNAPILEDVPVTPPAEKQNTKTDKVPPFIIEEGQTPQQPTEQLPREPLDGVVHPDEKYVTPQPFSETSGPQTPETVQLPGQIVASPDNLTFAWTNLDAQGYQVQFAPREVVLGNRPAEEDVSFHNSEITEVTTIATRELQKLANGGFLELVGDEFDYNSGTPKPQPAYEPERKALFTIMRGLTQSELSVDLEGEVGSNKMEFNTYLSKGDLNAALAKNKDVREPKHTLPDSWKSARVTVTGIVNDGKRLVLTRGIRIKETDNPLQPKAAEVLTASWRTPEEIVKHMQRLSFDDQAVKTFQDTYKPTQKVQF